MSNIIFATNNQHKLKEVKQILSNKFEILSLVDIEFYGEIPETSPTIEENALQKANYIFERYNTNVFSDDTGLEVEALNGAPGVYSARYAGLNCSFEDNVNKLLKEMQGKTNRNARFKTVIALIYNNKHYCFEGIINGQIAQMPIGDKGFGYDPIFIPETYTPTFAQMEVEQKNAISHRAIAIKKLVDFFNKN